MMNLYYEIAEALEQKFAHKFYVLYDADDAKWPTLGDLELAIRSTRIWCETENGVVYTKHRDDRMRNAVVDLEEFMWVKLKSSPIL